MTTNFVIIFVSSWKSQNMIMSDYHSKVSKAIREDGILKTIIRVVNADDPKNFLHLRHNNTRTFVHIPGFIIKYPGIKHKPISFGLGFANYVFKQAYLVYSYMECSGKVAKCRSKKVPCISIDIPSNISSFDCAMNARFKDYGNIDTIGSVVNSFTSTVRGISNDFKQMNPDNIIAGLDDRKTYDILRNLNVGHSPSKSESSDCGSSSSDKSSTSTTSCGSSSSDKSSTSTTSCGSSSSDKSSTSTTSCESSTSIDKSSSCDLSSESSICEVSSSAKPQQTKSINHTSRILSNMN